MKIKLLEIKFKTLMKNIQNGTDQLSILDGCQKFDMLYKFI